MTAGRAGRSSGLKKATVATVGDVHTRIIESAGSGPTVLLLHGFSDSADGWRDVMQRLADAGHRAVALDLPYFGRAERPASDTVLPALDEFVDAAVSQYETGDGVILVGNSVGGLAALRAAQRNLLPIVAVIAIGPAGLCTPWWMRVVNRSRPIADRLIRLPVPPVLRGTVTGPAVISAVFARAVASGRLTDTAKAQYASHWGPGDLRRQLALGGQTITELISPDVVDPARFVVPVTLVCGDRDWICPPKGAAAVQQKRPDVVIRRIHGSGHCPQYDRPDAVADIIMATLAAATARMDHTTTAKEPAT